MAGQRHGYIYFGIDQVQIKNVKTSIKYRDIFQNVGLLLVLMLGNCRKQKLINI